MNWTELLTEQGQAVYAAAKGVIAEVDDDAIDWKPTSGGNWMTVGQLLRHITTACGCTAHGFATGEWDIDAGGIDPEWKPTSEAEMMPPAEAFLGYGSKQEALDALEADHERFTAALATAGEARLSTERLAAPWGGPERLLGAQFFMGFDHLNTHKAQLFYYLKLQSKPVHTGVLWNM